MFKANKEDSPITLNTPKDLNTPNTSQVAKSLDSSFNADSQKDSQNTSPGVLGRRYLVQSRASEVVPMAELLADARKALASQLQKFKVSSTVEIWSAQECAAFKSLVSSALALEGYEQEKVDGLGMTDLSDEEVMKLSGGR